MQQASKKANEKISRQITPYKGVIIALIIICLWFFSLSQLLFMPVSFSFLTLIGVLIQTHLYTGLFITAHDSMHRLVSPNLKLNEWIGRICTTLFAFNFYQNLFTKHHQHHRYAGTNQDPDFYQGNFWVWYYHFGLQYINLWQILLMACTYNLLKLWFDVPNLIVYWMLPSVLSTFQLFYFGTYLPHKGEHSPDNQHRARSQQRNHWWAFLSCYFFGYHYEHHDSPATPWWQLYKIKDQNQEKIIG